MPISADGIRELMELGIVGEQLLAVVSLFEREASRQASRLRRDGERSKAAVRSKNYRDRQREASRLPSRSERDADTLTEVKKGKDFRGSKEVKKEKKPRASLLPADFQPKPAHFEKARELGRDEQFVRAKFEDMRIWATANGVLKVDWDATLHGFIRRDAKDGNGTGQGRTARFAGQPATGNDAVLAGMGRIAGRIHERRVSAGQHGDIPGGDDASGFLDLEPVRTSRN